MSRTAEQILSVPRGSAASLLGDCESAVRATFRKMVAIWHPDRSSDPRAAEVFRHLVALRDAALGAGPAAANQRRFTARGGRDFSMRYLAAHATDAGETFVGTRTLAQVFASDMADLADAEKETAGGFRFADQAMEDQMRMFLPREIEWRDLEDGSALQIQERSPGEVVLADLLARDGAMPPKHAAWLCSGLMNIAAFLTWSGRVHGAISSDTVMVDPESHGVRLFGGWGFSTARGTRPSMLPNRTLETVPNLAVAGEVAEFTIDLELVRRTVREAMGATSIGGLDHLDLPEPVENWLVMPPAKDGIADYAAWQAALEAGWGTRRFVVYPTSAAEIYASS